MHLLTLIDDYANRRQNRILLGNNEFILHNTHGTSLFFG